MDVTRLGRTGLMVSRSGFGGIPIQRIDFDEAGKLLQRAYEGGITFFDTARAYSDSEEKMGRFLSKYRDKIIFASKTPAKTAQDFSKDLDITLKNLNIDYIDIYQFHNPPFVPDGELYEAALAAKQSGKIRYIGITNHSLELANKIVDSKKFDTLQFPFSVLSSEDDIELVKRCEQEDIGFIAMKAMSGGLITNPTATFAFLRNYSVVPIWGMQYIWELEQFLELEAHPPVMTDELINAIERDKHELTGAFCRGCGYCLPTCPAKIDIPTVSRMSYSLKRLRVETLVSQAQQERMEKTKECIDCGECRNHCPYDLYPPTLFRHEYPIYREFLEKNGYA